MEFQLESYSDCQSVHEAVRRELSSPEKTSPVVMHIGACPVRKAYPVNGKIAFEYEEEYETYSGYIHDMLKWYPAIRSQPEGLRKQIKKRYCYKNPGHKSYKYPNLFLYRTASNPPSSVKTNVSAPKMIGNLFMHPLAFAGGHHYPMPATITSDSLIV